jgi:hypothetical protein
MRHQRRTARRLRASAAIAAIAASHAEPRVPVGAALQPLVCQSPVGAPPSA